MRWGDYVGPRGALTRVLMFIPVVNLLVAAALLVAGHPEYARIALTAPVSRDAFLSRIAERILGAPVPTTLDAVIIDASPPHGALQRFLTLSWWIGARIGGFDVIVDAKGTWEEAVADVVAQVRERNRAWTASGLPTRRIREIQFFGHGRSGSAVIGASAWLRPAMMAPLREVFVPFGARIWLRCCNYSDGASGLAAMRELAVVSGATFIAAHGEVIGLHQGTIVILDQSALPHTTPTTGSDAGERRTEEVLPCPPSFVDGGGVIADPRLRLHHLSSSAVGL